MSLDMSRLSFISVDLESRCRSIARNAMQASRVAHERGDALYTDDEAKRERMIEKILHLDLERYIDDETTKMVADIQPDDPLINRVSEILEKGMEKELTQPAQIAAPTPTQSTRKTKA